MKPKIYSSQDHHIRNDAIDPSALFVLKRLHEAGHTAYLVGGGVRDLLMHKKPKDFDISTSASPEEVKHLFRNCILIGRRFRLAHVRFGDHFVEVATFRAGDPAQEELIVRDNVFGNPEEDALRRDFTINGLFYDPLDHRIIDYVGGFEDLQKNFLRPIGDPLLRFKQDPVRMIRLIKFQARFGFEIDKEALNALNICREEITKSSPARVLEEMLRMLESGSSETFFSLLFDSQFLAILFPALHAYFSTDIKDRILSYLKCVDSMNFRGHYRTLDRSILTSALAFPILEDEIRKRCEGDHLPHIGEIIDLSHAIINDLFFDSFAHFPKKIRFEMHFILQMQYRLTPLSKKRKPTSKIIKHRDFILPLTFLKLRALVDAPLFKTYEHWKRIWREAEQEKEEAK